MKIFGKIILSIIIFVIGAIVAGIVKETSGNGNFIVLGITAAILILIWKK